MRSRGHTQFIAVTPAGGLTSIVHVARPRQAGCWSSPSRRCRMWRPAGCWRRRTGSASGTRPARESRAATLADLPLGESPLWSVREITASADSVAAVLPAWSAFSEVDLTARGLGFEAARKALVPSGDPWDARQAAMARYSRTGFEAAAVTAIAALMAAIRVPRRDRRVAELRFGHPYAVVDHRHGTATATADRQDACADDRTACRSSQPGSASLRHHRRCTVWIRRPSR